MKNIALSIVLLFVSLIGYGQTNIPTGALRGEIINFASVSAGVYLVEMNVQDYSGKINGTFVEEDSTWVVWQNCKRFVVTNIDCGGCALFNGNITVEISDVAGDGMPGFGFVTVNEENENGISGFIAQVDDPLYQCIDLYYKGKINDALTTMAGDTITAPEVPLAPAIDFGGNNTTDVQEALEAIDLRLDTAMNITLSIDGLTDGKSNTTSTVYLGTGAGAAGSPGTESVGVGINALNVSTGVNNTAIGMNSLRSNTTGFSNTAIGINSLYANTVRPNLVAVGDSALYNNGTGAFIPYHSTANTAVGSKALFSNTRGDGGTAIGTNALRSNTTGQYNTAIGKNALYSNTTGVRNVGVGQASLTANTTGGANTAIGDQSLFSNIDGNNNVAVGNDVGRFATSSNNTIIGAYAFDAATTSFGNTAVGANALSSQTTADYNTAIGDSTMATNTTGTQNTAIGALALKANSTSSRITAVGHNALGSANGAYGNTAVGASALGALTTGDNNTAIGDSAAVAITTNSNTVAVGYNAQPTASNQAVVGNTSVTELKTGTVSWFQGSGSPESVVTAVVGSYYTRTDGAAGTTLYIKQSGSGNTGWTAVNPSADGNGLYSIGNDGGAIVVETSTYADDLVLTGGGGGTGTGFTRLAADPDESYLFTMVNKNAIFLDTNTVYIGLDDANRAYLELEGLNTRYEGSTFSFANKTSAPVPTIKFEDADQSHYYGYKAADVVTANYTEITPTAGPGSNDMIKLHDTDGTTTWSTVPAAAGIGNMSDGVWDGNVVVNAPATDTILLDLGGQYHRIDSIVFFTYKFKAGYDFASAPTAFTIDLPVASNFTNDDSDVIAGVEMVQSDAYSVALAHTGQRRVLCNSTTDKIVVSAEALHAADPGGVLQRYWITVEGSYIVK